MANTQFPPNTNPLWIDVAARQPGRVKYVAEKGLIRLDGGDYFTPEGQFVAPPDMSIEEATEIARQYMAGSDNQLKPAIMFNNKSHNLDSLVNVKEENERIRMLGELYDDVEPAQRREVPLSPLAATGLLAGMAALPFGVAYAGRKTGLTPWLKYNIATGMQHASPPNWAKWAKGGGSYSTAPLTLSQPTSKRLLAIAHPDEYKRKQAMRLIKSSVKKFDPSKVSPEILDNVFKKHPFISPKYMLGKNIPHIEELRKAGASAPKPNIPAAPITASPTAGTQTASAVIKGATSKGMKAARIAKLFGKGALRFAPTPVSAVTGLLMPMILSEAVKAQESIKRQGERSEPSIRPLVNKQQIDEAVIRGEQAIQKKAEAEAAKAKRIQEMPVMRIPRPDLRKPAKAVPKKPRLVSGIRR